MTGRKITPACGRQAPRLGALLGVGEPEEDLALEEGLPHEGHGPFDARLVLGRANTTRVRGEIAGLRVLEEGLVEAWVQRVGANHDRLEIVRDDDPKHAAEELPGRLEPGDHVADRLPVREPHEAVPAEHSREDQRPHDTPLGAVRLSDEPHAAEVDLQLGAWSAVVDAHRGLALAEAELRSRKPMQGAVWHLLAGAPGQQGLHLGQLELVDVQPVFDLVPMLIAELPRLTTRPALARLQRQRHRVQEVVAQLLDAAVTPQPETGRPLHVATHGLGVQTHAEANALLSAAAQPERENQTDFDHSNLPICHRALPRLSRRTR